MPAVACSWPDLLVCVGHICSFLMTNHLTNCRWKFQPKEKISAIVAQTRENLYKPGKSDGVAHHMFK